LFSTDGKRDITVRPFLKRSVEETMPGDKLHGLKYPLVTDPLLPEGVYELLAKALMTVSVRRQIERLKPEKGTFDRLKITHIRG
jgi:hypothetical protein